MSNTLLTESYREHHQDLLRFLARRLRCIFTARDLNQEIYLKIEAGDVPGEIQNPRAYLFRMAANLATDHIRVEARRTELLAQAGELLDGTIDQRSPERDLIARDELERVTRAIAALPPQTRRIFRQNRFEHKTQREIAESLGISTTSVENHIRKALESLALARDGRE